MPAVAQARVADVAARAARRRRSQRAGRRRLATRHCRSFALPLEADRRPIRRGSCGVVGEEPEASLPACLDMLDAAWSGRRPARIGSGRHALLRRAKQEMALLAALADLGGAWTPQEVMAALTKAADVFVASALSFILQDEQKAGRLFLPKPAALEEVAGSSFWRSASTAPENSTIRATPISSFFSILPALRRRKWESPARPSCASPAASSKLLQERTADGYVLRVDLRLRPDPGSTAIAISHRQPFSITNLSARTGSARR